MLISDTQERNRYADGSRGGSGRSEEWACATQRSLGALHILDDLSDPGIHFRIILIHMKNISC
jgi:hypothetical protein